MIDSDAIIWNSSKSFSISHHEYSVKGTLYQKVTRIPKIEEIFKHPRGSFVKIKNYFFKNYSTKNLPTDRPALLLWDSRCVYNLYHWLIDALPRLSLLPPSQKKPYLLLPKDTIKRDYVLSTLKKFNFNRKDIILLDNNTRYLCHQLQVITTSILASGACSTQPVQQVQLKFKQLTKKINKRIYFARKPKLGRQIINESKFESLLDKYGFQKIFPEDYSFDDLQNLLSHTEIFIATYSASLAHAVLMPRKSSLIEVAAEGFIGKTPKSWKNNYISKVTGDYYYSLSIACQLKYYLVPCQQKNNNDFVLSSDFSVDLELLRKTIKLALRKKSV